MIKEFDITAFEALFEDKELAEAAFEPYFILGFITSVASAPELIMMSEWMPLLWRDEKHAMQFSSQKQASEFNQCVMGWWNYCNDTFQNEEQFTLPPSLHFSEQAGVSTALKQFSNGYLDGYDWVVELWDSVIDDDDDDEGEDSELSRLIGLLTMLFLQCSIHPEKLTDGEADDEEIPDMIEKITQESDLRDFIGYAVVQIGSMGHQIAKSQLLETSPDAIFPSEPIQNENRHVGRNEPCPCGSGKKYKKCCLH